MTSTSSPPITKIVEAPTLYHYLIKNMIRALLQKDLDLVLMNYLLFYRDKWKLGAVLEGYMKVLRESAEKYNRTKPHTTAQPHQ